MGALPKSHLPGNCNQILLSNSALLEWEAAAQKVTGALLARASYLQSSRPLKAENNLNILQFYTCIT